MAKAVRLTGYVRSADEEGMFMIHAEPRGPVGALEWTRKLRVGEARLVAGGYVAAGPDVAAQAGQAERRRTAPQRYPGSGDGFSVSQQLDLMRHRPC